MINGNLVDNSTKASTAFGTLITIFVNIQKDDLIKTIILAVVVGVSSFLATMFVKFLIKEIKKFRF
ncbi:MAG TPA: hypothetical protein DIS75_00400 [Chryseobacterium sp.]|nr:hypothetical protein [Chryseobacterium sp.]